MNIGHHVLVLILGLFICLSFREGIKKPERNKREEKLMVNTNLPGLKYSSTPSQGLSPPAALSWRLRHAHSTSLRPILLSHQRSRSPSLLLEFRPATGWSSLFVLLWGCGFSASPWGHSCPTYLYTHTHRHSAVPLMHS